MSSQEMWFAAIRSGGAAATPSTLTRMPTMAQAIRCQYQGSFAAIGQFRRDRHRLERHQDERVDRHDDDQRGDTERAHHASSLRLSSSGTQ